jgi:hypothetical protein
MDEGLILVLPFWKSAIWFPLVLKSIVTLPIRLPHHRDLLILEHIGKAHPLQKSLTLMAVIISGKHYKVKEFQDLLLMSSQKHRGKELLGSMSLPS